MGILWDEVQQRRSSGWETTSLDAGLAEGPPGQDVAGWAAALVDTPPLARASDWAYVEPDDEGAILASLPASGARIAARDDLADRIHGAWLGRCAGCVLGKPVEGWPPEQIRTFLREVEAWPPHGYLPPADPASDRYPPMKPSWPEATAGNVAGVPRDDDIDYTLLGLLVIETHGFEAGRRVLADEMLDRLPFTQVYTAERVAYANLVSGLDVDRAGEFRNPYREWIGALIRADIHGMTAPGMPRVAATGALRDAWLTHRGNGVYAAMWAAGAVSAAVAGASPRATVEAGLEQVPPSSRSAAAVRGVLADADDGVPWEEWIARLHVRFAEYGWVHTLPNLAAVAAAVLHGDGDLERTIGFAVAVGWDTDSAGATAGAIAGATTGASELASSWCAPLDDRITSAIRGCPEVRISDAADRTLRLAERRLADARPSRSRT
jgi:ADP-ribosylglycohydrolase